ncbi:MAG: hypothetical protein JJ949_10615 [Roseicyclus sp.]|nr:hypothetical protein [Roseicyclus sp.]MBO6924176.1 hypothetical protein [Roseicyclus sp.]
MKVFGILLAGVGAALLGYFGLVGVDTGIDGFRATNFAGLFIGSTLLVSGSVFVAAGEVIERLVMISDKPRTVIVKETISKSPPAPRNIAPPQRPSAPNRPLKEGEQVLVEDYMGTPIYKRYNGHFVGERWFAGIKQAHAYIDELARQQPD